MRPSGGYSNQDSGEIEKIVVELRAVLASEEFRAGLEVIARKLAVLRANGGRLRPIESRRMRRRRPGWILDAVLAVMTDQARPMRVSEVHAAVEAHLGETVSRDSVNWCLSARAGGPGSLFIRVARGRYVLASAS